MIIGLVLLYLGIVHELTYFGACVLVGLGNGLTMPSSNAGAMSVEPRLAGSASGLTSAFTVAVGAIMSGLAGAMLTPETAAYGLLGIMLATSLVGLAAASMIAMLRPPNQLNSFDLVAVEQFDNCRRHLQAFSDFRVQVMFKFTDVGLAGR